MFEQTNFPSKIIVHHSGTPDDPIRLDTYNYRRYQVGVRGWDDLGYHRVYEMVDGGVETLKGRPLYMHGSHCICQNYKSVGVCFAGNFNLQPPSDELLQAAVPDLVELCWLLKIHPTELFPHNAFAETDCPGRYFEVARLREMVKQAYEV